MRKNLIQYNINNLNNNLAPEASKFLSRTYVSLHNVEAGIAPGLKLEVQFLEWFVGFSDAESSFILHKVLDKKGDISKFSFMFTIELHIDDVSVLEFIKNKLKIGNLRTYKDKCIFTVSDKQGVYQLISIFDKFNLNTTKYLDYKNFKEAFLLYHERSSNVKIAESKELINKILGYKSNMNTKRSVIILPSVQEEYLSKINITKDWLLGFIEGDGSFFVSRTDIEPVFSIELSEEQYPMLVKIKEFLEYNLGFDKYSLFKLKSSSIISINKQKARLGKPTVIFSIKNIFVLNNYLIPLLDSMKFISKKGCDFKDFKVICGAVYRGSHKLDEIRSLILKLSYNMNNYRLSTNKKWVEILSEQERNLIINAESVYEYLEDGRIMDKKTNKPLIHRNCIYEIRLSDEEILLVDTMKEALSKVNVSFRTLKKLLDEEESVKLPNYEVKRIPIFTIKKI